MQKRTAIIGSVVVLILGVVGIRTQQAKAERGPDPDVGDFAFIVREAIGPGSRTYDRIEVDVEHPFGPDWGGRASYRCGMYEFLDGDTTLFEVDTELFTYQQVTGISVQIIDDANAQEPVQLGGCGSSDAKAANLVWDEATHGDHFPHADATGAGDIAVYQDFDHDGFFVEFHRIDYSSPAADTDGICGPSYWTPGNGPGEALLWWDEDGPSSPDGHSSLNCDPATGPGEPVAVARTTVELFHPDLIVCTLDPINGDVCSGELEPPPAPTGPTGPTAPTGPTGPVPVCGEGTITLDDGRQASVTVCI
ncbi:MAG: hypothetical protein L0Z49_12390 [Actinobacteria bacterium]|nr:hypothetical protein [Actinomycetota bacterium]